MRDILLLGVFLLLWGVSAQEPKVHAAIEEGDTELSFDDRPSEENTEWVRKRLEAEANRLQEVNAAMRNMMMGLRFEKRDVPVVRIPAQKGLTVRFMSPFRDGAFLAAHRRGHVRAGRIPDQGYYLAPAGRKIHRVRVAGVDEVHGAVVADQRAWFVGLTNGQAALLGVGERGRLMVPLPRTHEVPNLGLDGQSLMVVYAKTIYRLADRQWTLVHSGDIVLPRYGPPPRRHGDMVYLCGEGMHRNYALFHMLMMGEKSHPYLFGRDSVLAEPIALGNALTMGETSHSFLFGRDNVLTEPIVLGNPLFWIRQTGQRPDWGDASSHCVTRNGDLWACVADGAFLARRSMDGSYAIALADNSVEYREDRIDCSAADQGVRVSAVWALPDDSLLLAGHTGIYRIEGDELVQEIAFAHGVGSDSGGLGVRPWGYDLTNVLPLDDRSYVISSGARGGAYMLRAADDGQWGCLPLDEGDPVEW